MYTNTAKYSCPILLVILFLVLPVGAQQSAPNFLNNYQWLDNKDIKNWEKQLKLISEGDDLIQQSNSKYIEVYNLESGASTDGNKDKVEKEAFDLSTESLLTYRSAYEALYKITESYIEEEKKKHPAYDEAAYYKKESEKLYQNAGKVKTPDEQRLLANANENLLLAIEKSVIANTVSPSAYDVPKEETVVSNKASEEVEINNEVYQKYLDYINNDLIAEPITMNQLNAIQGEDVSYDEFQELWFKYNAGESLSNAVPAKENSETAQVQDIAEPITSETEITEQTSTEENINTQSETKTSTTAVVENNPAEATSASIVSNGFSLNKDLEYRVQVAAGKSQLSLTQLKALYSGNLLVLEIKEGNYYKYQVRSFKELPDAQKVVSESDVSSAFIHAYNGEERLDLWQAVKDLKEERLIVKESQKIDFSIQVAASRTRLTSTQLKRIYNGTYPISIVFEDGWYKYQLIVGNNLELANEVLTNCGVSKAFIAAYKNGRKMELYKAVDKYKSKN